MVMDSSPQKADQDINHSHVNSPESQSSSPRARKTRSRGQSWTASKRNSFPGFLEISNPERIQPPKPVRLSHRPSLSDTSFPPTLSPNKNRFRGAQTPITRPDFKFPDIQTPTFDEGLIADKEDIASPDSEKTLYSSENIQLSTYLSSPQPDLQGLFITLANKERQVLEARESLLVAESELKLFKKTWNSTLKKHENETIPSDQLLGNLTDLSHSIRLPRVSYRQVSGSGSCGLGIYQVPYELSETAKQRNENQSLANLSLLQEVDTSINFDASFIDDSDAEPKTLLHEIPDQTILPILLERIASIGMFILKELAALLLFGTSEDERPHLSIQPRYPSVIETYYNNSMLSSIGRARDM